MDEEPPAKKQMLEEKNINSIQKEVDFSEFRIDQVLLNDVKSKRVHVLGIAIRRFPFVILFAPSSVVKQFHAAGLFLYPMKTEKNQRFSEIVEKD